MKDQLGLQIERAKQQEKYFKNWRHYAEEIKKVAQDILGEVEVYVFGSILRKDEVAQDIDILIISSELKSTSQKSRVKAEIWKELGIGDPFEIHLITPEEYQQWYDHFIEEKEQV